jgi:hypothetical protein
MVHLPLPYPVSPVQEIKRFKKKSSNPRMVAKPVLVGTGALILIMLILEFEVVRAVGTCACC